VQRRREERNARLSTALHDLLGNTEQQGQMQCAGLGAPRDGEAMLLLLPTEIDTIVLWESAGVVRVHRAPEVPNDDGDLAGWARDVVALVEDDLDEVASVRVLPLGRAWLARMHAVPYRGTYLGWDKAVSYGLDLPPVAPRTGGRSAVVVTDPSGDLPNAKTEGEVVALELERDDWDVVSFGGAAARRESVLSAMTGAQLFHYAGHGVRRGEDGWDSSLLLGDSETIGVYDVISLLSPPRFAVLAGCESGALSALLADGGMSVGRGLLAAGAESVLVGEGEVADDDTLVLVRALFADVGEIERLGLAGLLHRALRDGDVRALELRSWSAFRVLVR
jgi:CHAT domain